MVENEFRRDTVEDRLVIVAPVRGKRPHGGLRVSPPERHPRGACALCPARIDAEPSHLVIPDGADGWRIKVVANKFPAVQHAFPNAYGSHELVIETPDPRRRFEEFSVREIGDVLAVVAARVAALRADRTLRYVTAFKNVGDLAGASVAHAHSQIVATAVVPPAVVGRHARLEAARHRLGDCPLCTLAASARRGARRIAAADGVVAFAPYASAFPYEAWVVPASHRTSLTDLEPREIRAAAAVLRGIVRFLARRGFAYNLVMDELFGAKEMHFAMKVFPRATIWAGVELANGMVVNPVPPERAAAEYRRAA